MHTISDDDFAKIAGEALDSLPDKLLKYVRNVAIVYADEPTPEQRVKLKLRDDQTLFGLYEGIPQIQRGAGYIMVLPDKITIFKLPLFHASHDDASLRANVRHTLWHEIAHHFGLDHDRIHELEDRKHLKGE
jgi:predicted Zn-dependent protease with MMP-like domain